jgi:hypothetical protein
MIEHDAAYGGSHFTLALVLRRQGDATGTAREIEAARRYWRDADRDLPELKTMAEQGARQRGSSRAPLPPE